MEVLNTALLMDDTLSCINLVDSRVSRKISLDIQNISFAAILTEAQGKG